MGRSRGVDKWSRPPPTIDLFALEVVILGHCAWADPEGWTSGPDPPPPILILKDLFATEVVI